MRNASDANWLRSSRRAEPPAAASKFHTCDIVWVKLFSFPWWPGTLFDSSWLSDDDRVKKKPGTVCIRFFGTYEQCYLVPDEGNLYLYSEFAEGQPPASESTKSCNKIQEKRQQESKKYKLALFEAATDAESAQPVDASEEKGVRRRRRKKVKSIDALSSHDDFNALFAASQKYRPLPCVHSEPPDNHSGA